MKKIPFDIETLHHRKQNTCFVCQKKIDEADIIYEDDSMIAFLDANPAAKGQTIVAPKNIHVEDITEYEEVFGNLIPVITKETVLRFTAKEKGRIRMAIQRALKEFSF